MEKAMVITAERAAAFAILFASGLVILVMHGRVSRRFTFSPGGFTSLSIAALVAAAATAFFFYRAATSTAENELLGPFNARALLLHCALPISAVPAYFTVFTICQIWALHATADERARIAALCREHLNLRSLADSLGAHERFVAAEIDARRNRIATQRIEMQNLETEAKNRLILGQPQLVPIQAEIDRLVSADGVSGIIRAQNVAVHRAALRRLSRVAIEERVRALEGAAHDDDARLDLLAHQEALLLADGNPQDVGARRANLDRLVRETDEETRRFDDERRNTTATRNDIDRRAEALLDQLNQQRRALHERRITF
jgi:hypothetical protein